MQAASTTLRNMHQQEGAGLHIQYWVHGKCRYSTLWEAAPTQEETEHISLMIGPGKRH